jgi:hypothetical protein
MLKTRFKIILVSFLSFFVITVQAQINATKIVIIEGKDNSIPERNVVASFTKRVLERSDVTVERIDESEVLKKDVLNNFNAVILLGQPSRNSLVQQAFVTSGVRPPQGDYPGPEGFVIKTIKGGIGGTLGTLPVIIASGVDERGTIYALTRLMRESKYLANTVEIPDLNIIDKPAFEYRGSGMGFMDRSQAERTGASRKFDVNNYIDDQIIFGYNILLAGGGTLSLKQLKENENSAESGLVGISRVLDDRGIMFLSQYAPNGISRDDWKEGFRGRWLACPSNPEAREVMLKGREELFKRTKRLDVLLLVSGDEAGCQCELCAPWVRTYVDLVEDIAKIYHKYFPDGKIWLTTQQLKSDEKNWLWDYLNKVERPWLNAVAYAPGADELSPYLNGHINHDYERYIGMARESRYIREMLKQVPRTLEITSFPDISHWVSSQYQQPVVAPEMAAVYERRTFNIRARQMEDIFRKTAGYTIGTVAYAEGIFDDVNKAVWLQLHWNPNLTAEKILYDYYRWYCGSEAAPELVEAALLLEENMKAQVLGNGEGYEKYLNLVRSAGAKMSPGFRKNNWRYIFLLEKGLTDLYVYHKVEQGSELLLNVNNLLMKATRSDKPKVFLQNALDVLGQNSETEEMIRLREESKILDDELNESVGYRFIALLNMVEMDLVGVTWYSDQIKKLIDEQDINELKQQVGTLANYENPGDGGYYDNGGNYAEQPHLTFGTSNYWDVIFSPGLKPSQVLINYSFAGEQGVTYTYNELDKKAEYKIRVTYALPEESWWAGRKIRQRVLADGIEIGGPIEIERNKIQQLEYDIPSSITKDGRVEIEFAPDMPESITVVNEIWLIKKH